MLRRVPRAVIAYAALQVALFCWGFSHHGLGRHPALTVVAYVIVVAFLSAIVVFRQRWAWWIDVVLGALYIAAPARSAINVVAYVANLATLALLLSPSMRAWVRLHRPPPLARDQPKFGPNAT